MPLVVDASVVLKWVIDEPDSDAAKQLLTEDALMAPDLLFVECANSLCMKVRRGQINSEVAVAAFAAIEAAPITSVTTRSLVAAAQTIALALKQTAYDSLYLAVALAERATFVTADRPFVTAAQTHAHYREWVRLLEP